MFGFVFDMFNVVGIKITEARKAAKMSQKELSEILLGSS